MSKQFQVGVWNRCSGGDFICFRNSAEYLWSSLRFGRCRTEVHWTSCNSYRRTQNPQDLKIFCRITGIKIEYQRTLDTNQLRHIV